jgi:hypothetical protein
VNQVGFSKTNARKWDKQQHKPLLTKKTKRHEHENNQIQRQLPYLDKRYVPRIYKPGICRLIIGFSLSDDGFVANARI